MGVSYCVQLLGDSFRYFYTKLSKKTKKALWFCHSAKMIKITDIIKSWYWDCLKGQHF